MTESLRLISHHLCPYVQRALIVAAEKEIPVQRVDIDLSNKPDWFLAISPTGKTPLLEVTRSDGSKVIVFESAVIAELLDEISGKRLLPDEPFARAQQRAWVEFASATLSSIGQLYLARDFTAFHNACDQLAARLAQVEKQVAGPWFAGPRFGLVDAAFGPAFRYLDVFKARAGIDLLQDFPATAEWATGLAERPSIRGAVAADYPERLVDFIRAKGSYLGQLLEEAQLAA